MRGEVWGELQRGTLSGYDGKLGEGVKGIDANHGGADDQLA